MTAAAPRKSPTTGFPGASPGRTDGRRLRSAATRSAVAEAYLDLLEAGDPRPTARAIAERAGVSERAVFRHFQDMETLLRETAEAQIRRVTRDLPGPPEPGAATDAKAAALAERWCLLHERVSPVRRIAILHEPFSPEIARRLSWARMLILGEIEQAFAPELASRADEERRRATAALAAALAWETWNELRARQGLDPASATATVRAMLGALVSAPIPP